MSDEAPPEMFTDIPTKMSGEEIWQLARSASSSVTSCLPHITNENSEMFLAAIFSSATDIEASLFELRAIPKRKGAKCRCDAQWYGDKAVPSIAFGCKTCALSSASCICVACFDAGDHEGHEFYVSKSEYGCCDCGDPFAWKSTGFCPNHLGPEEEPIVAQDDKIRCEQLLDAIVANWSSNTLIYLILKICLLNDYFRKISGRKLLDPIIQKFLPSTHLWPAEEQQAWANLLVDLMLDTEFKFAFATKCFSDQYKSLVLARVGLVNSENGRKYMSDLGDFTCQMFTRPDVALTLVCDQFQIEKCFDTISEILEPAMTSFDPRFVDSTPAHGSARALIDTFVASLRANFDAGIDIELDDVADDVADDEEFFRLLDPGNPIVYEQETMQSSMDLIYLLDHPSVRAVIHSTPDLLSQYVSGFSKILFSLQGMNPHKRRLDTHVEFPDPHWSSALAIQADLFSSFWLMNLDDCVNFRDQIKQMVSPLIPPYHQNDLYSLHAPLNRVLALTNNLDIQNISSQMSPSLQAFVFHTQVSLGLWKRNGDSVLLEAQFYNSPFFHHHLGSADRRLFRFFFDQDPSAFESFAFKFVLEREGWETSVVLLLLFLHTTSVMDQSRISWLAVKPRTFTQLRDPVMERWSKSLMPKYLAELEEFVAGPFVKEGFELSNLGWMQVDFVSPFLSWKDMQTVENRFFESKQNLSEWYTNCAKFEFSENLINFIFTSLNDFSNEFAVLRLSIHLLLRSRNQDWKSTHVETLRNLLAAEQVGNMRFFIALLLGEDAVAKAPRKNVTDRKAMQAAMMAKLGKKRDAFIQAENEEEIANETEEQVCVVCRSSGDLGTLGYISRTSKCINTSGRLITRTCGHKLHAACSHNISTCPYCTRPVNYLFQNCGSNGSIDESSTMMMSNLLEKLEPGISQEGFLVPLFRLVKDLFFQLTLSPSCESDDSSLLQSVPLLLAELELKIRQIDRPMNPSGIVEKTICAKFFKTSIPIEEIHALSDMCFASVLLHFFVDSSHPIEKRVHNSSPIIELPNMYQKLFTRFLPERSLCLLCGESDHETEVLLELTTGLVYIRFSTDKQIARWGTLYLDSHEEEDVSLSKPLTLSTTRVALLGDEIRENSWKWRAKNLDWKYGPVNL